MLVVLLHLSPFMMTVDAQPLGPDVTRSSTNPNSPRDTWVSNGPNARIYAIIVDPTNSNVLYAQSLLIPGGIFKSVDKGSSWLPSGQGLDTLRVTSIAINPQDARILYATTNDGVYKTVDAGGQWFPTAGPRKATHPVAVDPTDPRIIYAGTSFDLISSRDSGNTWNVVSHLLDPGFLDKIVVDPADPSVIYAAYNLYEDDFFSYLSKSTDAGVSFHRLELENTGGHIVFALRIDPISPRFLKAATPYGIYESTNAGSTWFRRVFCYGTSALAIMPLEFDHLFTSFYNDKGYSQGVSESTDDGRTWASMGTGLADIQIYVLELDSSGTRLYAATQSGVYSIRTAADVGPATVSGRFTSVGGRGLSNVTGSITDTLGGSQTFRGNQMGFYRISNVNPGSRYIIAPTSKSNTFAPRTLQVNGPLTNVNFTPKN